MWFKVLFLKVVAIQAYLGQPFPFGIMNNPLHNDLGSIQRGAAVKHRLPKHQWFQQTLDHFRSADDRKWAQRFWVLDKFYRPGGPAYLMIEGESAVNTRYLLDEFPLIQSAKENEAIVFLLEHRFYGESLPFKSLELENLVYLSSDQALADIANFVSSMNSRYSLTDAKWVAFGCSYAGSLAAWIRLKYPHLIHAALSSSAPLLAKPYAPELAQEVLRIVGKVSPDCLTVIHEKLTRALDDPEILEQLRNKLDVCAFPNDTKTSDKIKGLYSQILQNLSIAVQRPIHNAINKFCEELSKPESDEPPSMNEICLDTSDQVFLSMMKNTTPSHRSFGRQWLYQSCNEFGRFPLFEAVTDQWSEFIPTDDYAEICVKVFGPNFDLAHISAATDGSNRNYGGLGIQVTNVLFVQGTNDPWRLLGAPEDISNNIPSAGHCSHIYPEQDHDSVDLRQARAQIAKTIRSWVK